MNFVEVKAIKPKKGTKFIITREIKDMFIVGGITLLALLVSFLILSY